MPNCLKMQGYCFFEQKKQKIITPGLQNIYSEGFFSSTHHLPKWKAKQYEKKSWRGDTHFSRTILIKAYSGMSIYDYKWKKVNYTESVSNQGPSKKSLPLESKSGKPKKRLTLISFLQISRGTTVIPFWSAIIKNLSLYSQSSTPTNS